MVIFYYKSIHFLKLMAKLVVSAPFITISFIGNGVVFVFAALLFFIENGHNPKITCFMDALWWSFSTTTTIGYGDVVPVTFLGRIVGIGLMLIGVAIFAMYTALFSRAVLDDSSYMQ